MSSSDLDDFPQCVRGHVSSWTLVLNNVIELTIAVPEPEYALKGGATVLLSSPGVRGRSCAIVAL